MSQLHKHTDCRLLPNTNPVLLTIIRLLSIWYIYLAVLVVSWEECLLISKKLRWFSPYCCIILLTKVGHDGSPVSWSCSVYLTCACEVEIVVPTYPPSYIAVYFVYHGKPVLHSNVTQISTETRVGNGCRHRVSPKPANFLRTRVKTLGVVCSALSWKLTARHFEWNFGNVKGWWRWHAWLVI